MTTLKITTAAEALNLLQITEPNFDEINFDDLVGFSLKLKGYKYDGTITPPIMGGFYDFQKSIYRAFALIKTGDDNINSLTEEEKKSLEIVVGVSKGSSDFSLKNAAALANSFKAIVRNMSGTQRVIALAIIAVVTALYFGEGATSIWTQYQIEEKKIEAGKFAEKQQTERLQEVVNLAEKSILLNKILLEADRANRSIISGAISADNVELEGKALSKETAHKILEQPAPSTRQTRIDGVYRVLNMNTNNDEHFGVKLVEVSSGRTFSAKIDNMVLKQYQDILQKAVFDRQPVHLKVNATLKGEYVTDAFVVFAEVKNDEVTGNDKDK